MTEECVDVSLYLDKELASKLQKMTKKELLNQLVVLVLKTRVQQETIDELEQQVKDNAQLKTHLAQAQAMLRAATAVWQLND